MNKQITLSALADELAQAQTRKKVFLEQMECIIPWSEWVGIIKPRYYSGEHGNIHLESYIQYLESANLIYLSYPVGMAGKKNLKARPKI